MAAMIKIARTWTATILLFAAISTYWASSLWPPVSHWYDLKSLQIEDARVGEQIHMRVDREIVRPFVGDFKVLVRKKTQGGWEVICNGQGGGDYRTDAKLPHPLTLDWWSNRACSTINEPGLYMVTTTISLFPGFHLRRTLVNESNIFEVTK